jgi:hypothetical protein
MTGLQLSRKNPEPASTGRAFARGALVVRCRPQAASFSGMDDDAYEKDVVGNRSRLTAARRKHARLR